MHIVKLARCEAGASRQRVNAYRLAVFALFVFFFSLIQQLRADPGPMMLWYSAPGVPGDPTSWEQEALPIGNGKLAAMIYGGVGSEQIQFNEDTIWGGKPHDYSNPNTTPARLSTIQTDCFNRANILSEATSYLMSIPIRQAAYQAPGVLNLTFPHSGTLNYKRSLDLTTATANVHYDYGGVTYDRDIFASAPSNRVIAIHFTSNPTGKISFTCTFSTLQTATTSTSGNDLIMHARVTAIADSRWYVNGLTNAVEYDARARINNEGGSVIVGSNFLRVTNATSATLLLAVASNVKNYNDLTADYVTICSNNIAAAAAMAYADLRAAQLNDYTNLFNRVVLDLGTNSQISLPTGARIRQNTTVNDPQLYAVWFQMARYMMIAGSRPGAQTLNLQGKWNDTTVPGWDGKMTLNINQEMNYWAAEAVNLSECTLPLFDMIQDLSVTGNKVARSNYFSTGWVAHHNTDLWRGAAAINGVDGIWPTGGAWMCQHLWWHYEYTGDTNWLATVAYPLMKGAAQFFQGFLVPHPTYGWMVTCPSYSPEHDEGTYNVSNVPGPTMDNELVRDLFNHVISACRVLGVDASFSNAIFTLRSQLPPEQIGHGGQLQEWLEDVDGNGYDAGHRHCSHLVGFFPGDLISPFYTPTTAMAAKVSVDLRADGGTDKGWCKAWREGFRDRLFDGDHSLLLLSNLVTKYLTTNMMFTDWQNRQVDGTFGSLAGMTEMFLQSQSGEMVLLPAVPSKWTNGTVSGLCGRGGFEVDNLSWTNGKLAGATILSKLGNTCNLRSKWPIDVKLGTTYVTNLMVLPGLYQFPTLAGSNYTIVPATVAETETLPVITSAGDTHQILTNAMLSNVRGTLLNANAQGDFVTYTVSNVTAGNYHIYVGADAGVNRGKFQLACGPSGGALANVGPQQDTYSPTNITYLLPINLYTPTNLPLLWSSMLREFDCDTWQAPSNGNYQFQFTVAGKNGSSSGYNLSFDYIKFTPASASGPANQAPTDISLSNSNVGENQPIGTMVGSLSTTDPNAGNTFTYSLVGGTGSTDNASFSISGSSLQSAAVFDYETKNSYSIRIRTTDQGGLFFEKAFTISVTNLNETPTDIALSNSSVPENQPLGTAVGAFTSSDPDAANTFTYTLVSGTGSADNSSFAISGSALQTAAVFDFETKSTYTIRVRATDQGSLFFEKSFSISVANVNEAPTDISLSNASISENQPIGTIVGNLSSTDPDAGNTFTYSLVAGAGSADNASFTFSGSTLQSAASFDFETRSSYSIRIRTTDQGGLFFEKAFTISVANVNEAPTDISLSNVSVPENQPAGTGVGVFSSTDPDAGNTFSYSLVAGAGSTDNGEFTITDSNLQTAAVFDFETRSNSSIRVRTTDQDGLFFEKVFTVSVTDVNETPTDVSLSNLRVLEDQPVGTIVGAFNSSDPDEGDTFGYSLVSGSGSSDNDSFSISGSSLLTAAVFDFEARDSYSVRVRTTDQGGLFFEKAFTISVTTNTPPTAPTNSSPADGGSVQLTGVTLQGSPFNDPDAGDSQAAAEWLIQRASDNAVVFDSGEDVVNKTSVVAPTTVLEFTTTYNWQVRYEDSHSLWSDYSTATAFTTAAPSLVTTVQQGQLVISWPTNANGFVLESTLDLSGTIWDAVYPEPTPVGAWNYVTNLMNQDVMFYRLHKP